MILRNSSNKPIQIDNYKVLSQLGRGGFGTIYHVVDIRDSSKEYALKFLKSTLNVKRIQKQLNLLKILNTSELFLQTYLSKKVKGNLFLIMEYTKELNLEKIVRKEPFSELLACGTLLDILNSLEFLQKHHIIHGDIKAENILKKEKRFYLIDFDIIKTQSPSKTIHIQNDDDFTAPEIYRGIQVYSSDIYSLGCVLYYMLSGEHIYRLNSDWNFSKKMFAHLYSQALPHANISKKMAYLISRMTDKDHKTRATIKEIHNILNNEIIFNNIKEKDVVLDTYQNEFDRYLYMANDGISYAQNILALIYENGTKVEKNLDESFKWYELSASQGLAKAQFNLALCYKDAKGCEKNYVKAMAYFIKATCQKHSRSFFKLGEMYEQGLAIKSDMDKAKLNYEKAALHGYKPAYEKLKELL